MHTNMTYYSTVFIILFITVNVALAVYTIYNRCILYYFNILIFVNRILYGDYKLVVVYI